MLSRRRRGVCGQLEKAGGYSTTTRVPKRSGSAGGRQGEFTGAGGAEDGSKIGLKAARWAHLGRNQRQRT